ncbi:MAG TPA: NB-ARC domain-containing protein [Ktedonobacteraceae bacterium]|nr:NB-ARC domain-containing protein [Ktedonobacteraceae bacterium]
MSNELRNALETFSQQVQRSLRSSGYTQMELAEAMGLHPKVLSRKLNGTGNSHLTHREIKTIISTLADWQVITTQDEALQLLELVQVGRTIFSEDEWNSLSLSAQTVKRAQPFSSSSFPTYTHLHNLPVPLTRLIGREWEEKRLQRLFKSDEVRLVTLVGPGGVGKTRLAQHVAGKLIHTFAQGAWFVSLAGQRDPALVPISIMEALNIQSTPDVPALQCLINYLKDRQLLLVLDNFEQIAEAAPLVAELLEKVPGLKVLTTSRSVLRLTGEHKFSVSPLDVPDLFSTQEVGEISRSAAVQLFVERARAMEPNFELTSKDALTIAQVCARVDGLPLALELAAARMKILSPEKLLERLAQARLPMLTRGASNLSDRQQTLRNTIAWSYDLLSPVAQAWFRRLGIFTGSWALEAVEAMFKTLDSKHATTFSSPVDILEELVDNSLLVSMPVARGEARFSMLETLREYALEQLAGRGEHELLRDWHACYYLQEAEAAEQGLRGPQQLEWLSKVEADRDNFRSALEWALSQAKEGKRLSVFCRFPLQAANERVLVAGSKTFCSQDVSNDSLQALELCLRMASSLRHYWEWQGHLTEARYWLGAVLEIPLPEDAGETLLAARAKALSEYSRLTCLQNDQPRAIELAEASIAIWRQLDDPSGLATALLHYGWACHASGEYERAKQIYCEAMDVLAGVEDTWLRGQLFVYLGATAGFTYDFEKMLEYYAQSRELFRRINDTSALADVLKDQGGLSLVQGNCDEAIRCLLKSMKMCYSLGHKQYMTTGMCLLSLAIGLRREPDPATASLQSARIQGAADGLMDAIGLNPWTRNNPLAQMIRQQIRSEVDEPAYEAAWEEGRRFTVEQAIDLAYQLGKDLLD